MTRIERSNKKRRARLQTNMDHVRQITSPMPSTLPGQGKGGQSEDQHGRGRGSFTPSTDTDGIQRHEDSGSPTRSDPLLGSERLTKGAEVSPTTGLRHRTYYADGEHSNTCNADNNPSGGQVSRPLLSSLSPAPRAINSVKNGEAINPRWHLDENNLRCALGSWLGHPVIQTCINYFELALKWAIIQDIKDIVDTDPESCGNYTTLLCLLEGKPKNVFKDLNNALLEPSRRRPASSMHPFTWNLYSYDGVKHPDNIDVIDMNHPRFGANAPVREGKRIGWDGRFKAFLRTKLAQISPCASHELGISNLGRKYGVCRCSLRK